MGASTSIREGSDRTDKPVERAGKTSPGMATENQVGGKEMEALRKNSAPPTHNLHEFQVSGMSSAEHSPGARGSQNERSSVSQSPSENPETSKIKSLERKEGAKPGDYTLNSTTVDGRKTTDTHVGNTDGGFTDTREGGGRTTVNTYDKDNNRVYGKDTQNDGSSHEFKRNKDGSTTDRFAQKNGDYSEYTEKSGKTTSLKHEGKPGGGFVDTKSGADGSSMVHDQDSKGNFKETTTTKEQKKSTLDHTAGKDGAFTEKLTDSDGKVTTKDHTPTENGGFKETTTKPDGATVDKRQQPDGSFSELSQDKDGNFQSLKTHDPKAEGGFKDTTSTPDGRFTHDQKPNGEFTETSLDSKGKPNSPPFEVRGNPSEAFVNKTRNEINQLPAGDRKLLADNGYKFVAGESVAQAQPGLANEAKPTGTGPNGTWAKSTVGVNYHKEITVGEKIDGRDVRDQSNQTLDHEAGHAVDATLGKKQDATNENGGLSKTKDFADAYGKDFSQLNSKERHEKFAYETQMGHYPTHPESAKREAFAQAYAAVRDTSGTNPSTKETLERFPNTVAYVKEHLQDIDR
jgi:hypothetical protein